MWGSALLTAVPHRCYFSPLSPGVQSVGVLHLTRACCCVLVLRTHDGASYVVTARAAGVGDVECGE